jgi:hypothetical protein
MTAEEAIELFRAPSRLWTRAELIARNCPIPSENGIYGWYFDALPHPDISAVGTSVAGRSLLYVGIAPGRPGSASNLRKRLRIHLSGTARRSTLRLSLGSLLAERLELQAVPNSGGVDFGGGEREISEWLDAHARVAWFQCAEPWLIEAEVVRTLGVPLNRGHNQSHPFYPTMGELRLRARLSAATPSE